MIDTSKGGFFKFILRGCFGFVETPPQYVYKNLRNSDCFSLLWASFLSIAQFSP